MNADRPILCPKCLANCLPAGPDHCRCFSCGWQGPITSTPEYPMQNHLAVTNVRFYSAKESDQSAGLLGFVEFVLNGSIRVTGVAVRRTRAGRYALSFPAPRRRPIFAPVDDTSRETIERQVFAAIGLGGYAAR